MRDENQRPVKTVYATRMIYAKYVLRLLSYGSDTRVRDEIEQVNGCKKERRMYGWEEGMRESLMREEKTRNQSPRECEA